MLADPVEMAAAVLGAVGAGATAVPLNPTATPVELGRHIRHLGLAAVVADGIEPDPAGAIADTGAAVWRSEQGRLRLAAHGQDGRIPLPGDGAALLLASSGTTGAPKIIPLTEAQLLRRGVVAVHELTADDCGYSPLPLFHINGLVVGVLSGLVAGSRLVLDRRFSARSLGRWPPSKK